MTEKWVSLRGFTVVSTAFNSMTVYDRDMRVIQTIQRDKMLRDPSMAAATLADAQAEAMTEAARNENAGFVAVRAIYPTTPSPLPNASSAPPAQKLPNGSAAPGTSPLSNVPAPSETRNIFLAPDNDDKPKLWYCPNCRKMITSKFCPDCGAKRKV